MNKLVIIFSAVLVSVFLSLPVSALAHDGDHDASGDRDYESTEKKMFGEGSGSSVFDDHQMRESKGTVMGTTPTKHSMDQTLQNPNAAQVTQGTIRQDGPTIKKPSGKTVSPAGRVREGS